MKPKVDRDNLILKVLKEAKAGLESEEIRQRLPRPKPDTRQFDRSMRRLWNQCLISRIDKPNKWGHHSFYIPSTMFGYREETRLADALFGVAMSYLEDLCQVMPFEEAYMNLLGNVESWTLSLRDPRLIKAYRDFFNPAQHRKQTV